MGKVILGGGIGGLSSAHYMLKKFPKEIITVLEATDRTGGWIKSTRQENGFIYEQGPRTIRPRGLAGANTLQLVEDLHMEKDTVSIPSNHPAALNRMVYVNGQLHSLPSKFINIFQTNPPFSKPLIRFLMNDILVPKKVLPEKDESIYNFIERRFGQEVADYAISPLICGICAGNAKEISVRFLMDSLFDQEQKYGSIIKGVLYNSFKKNKNSVINHCNLSKKAKQEKWSVYSFKGGLETLPKALENSLITEGVSLHLNTACTQIEIGKNVKVHTNNGKVFEADHIVSSLPAKSMGNLLQTQHPALANLLTSIRSVNVGVINLEYDKKLNIKEGFGFLIPPKENLPLLGVIFDSCCFPNAEGTLLTVMMGGYWFEKHFGDNPKEENLLNISLKHLKEILGITEAPVAYRVNILKECIPQYTIGHKQKVNDIMSYITSKKLPISLCGVSYHGVGVNDVILSAKNVIENINT